MKNIKHLVLSLWLFACLLIGFVQAQTEFTTYQDPQQAFSIAYPADWQVVPETDAVSIDADEDTGFYIYAEPLGPEDLEDFVSLTPSTLMDMTLAGMRQEIPDLQVVETNEVTVDGFPAMALRFNATDQATQVSLTGRLVVFASEDHFFILASVSDVASYPQVEPVLEEMHASFTLAPDEPPVDESDDSSEMVDESDDSSEMVDETDESSEMVDETDDSSEMVDETDDSSEEVDESDDSSEEAENPLDLRTPSAPFAGTFSSERLTLVLESEADAYHGQLTFGEQTFAVSAEETEGELTGTFESGENTFGFTATLNEDTLTFVTGDTSYVLQKETRESNPLG